MATKKATKKSIKNTTKKSSENSADNYTKPELRGKIKKKVLAGNKGGRAGQWSARKAQLVAQEYKAEGGGYTRPRSNPQKSLRQWGEEQWHTSASKKAVQGNVTHRYLPDKAWNKLSAAERKATDRKKVAGSKRGKQFVPNTPAAAKARKRATKRGS